MRGPRISYPNAVFHIINRFVDKHPFFKKDEDYRCFLDIYYENANIFKICTYAHSIMPNHFHYVAETLTGNISDFLQRFLSKTAHILNKKYGRTGHLFQSRTKTLLVQTDLYFETVVKYVLLNPVKAKLTTNIFEYPYSSANDLLNLNENKICFSKLWEYLFNEKFENNDKNKIKTEAGISMLNISKISMAISRIKNNKNKMKIINEVIKFF